MRVASYSVLVGVAIVLGTGLLSCGRTTDAPPSPARCNESVTLARHSNVWDGPFGFDDTFLYYPVFDDDPSASVSFEPAKSHTHAIWRVSLAGGRDERVWAGPTGIFGTGLAVAGGRVYVTGERGDVFAGPAEVPVVWRVPASGGTAELVATFASGCAPYGGIAVDETNVYFAQIGCHPYGAGYLGRVPLEGGSAAALWLDRDALDFGRFVLTGSSADFFVRGPGGGVFVTPADGTATPKTLFQSSVVDDIAADDAEVFIAAESQLYAVTRDIAVRRTLVSGIAMRNLTLLGDHIYGVVRGGENGSTRSRVVRVPRRGGAAEVVVPDSDRGVSSLSVHGKNLYWAIGADVGGGAELQTMEPCP